MADKIITHPATDEYRAGYDRIFRKTGDGVALKSMCGVELHPAVVLKLVRALEKRVEANQA